MAIEFNERNLPKGYVVMGTPGEPLVPGAQANKFTEAGIVNKILKGLRLGYDAIEVDLWYEGEIYEPRLYERIKRIKDVAKAHGKDLVIGIHLPPAIDPAMGVDPYWHDFHRQIARLSFVAGHVVEAKFVLLHSCSTPKPEFSEQPRRRSMAGFLVDHYGRNIGELLIESSNNPSITGGIDLKSWFKLMYPRIIYHAMGVPADIDVVVELEKFRWDKENNLVARTARDLGLLNSKDNRKKYERTYETVKDVALGLRDIAAELVPIIIGRARALIKPLQELTKIIGEKIEAEKNNQKMVEELASLTGYILNLMQEIEQEGARYESAASSLKGKRAEKEEDAIVSFNNAMDTLGKAISWIYGGGERQSLAEGLNNILSRVGILVQQRILELDKLQEIIKSLNIQDLRNVERTFFRTVSPTIPRNVGYYLTISEETLEYWFKSGAQGEERIVYHIMAKYMYLSGDHLWERIVTPELQTNNKNPDPDDIIKNFIKAQQEGNPEKIEEAQKDIDLLVAAVGARYIVGHFQREIDVPEEMDVPQDLIEQWKKEVLDPKKNYKGYMSFYDYCLSRKMHIFIETSNPAKEAEGEMRLMEVKHHMDIIREMNGEKYTEMDAKVLGLDRKWVGKKKFEKENISYTFDFAHMVANYKDPMKQIIRLKPSKKDKHGRVIEPGDAYYIGMCHINPPRAQEMHAILRSISNDMDTIYRWLWALRERGMLNAYFVWEEGGESGVKESPIAFRRLVEFLNRGISYDELAKHPEFFGIDEYFLEEQKRAWQVHGLDPLRNLFLLPHPDHGLIRGAFRLQRERSPGEEWR